MMNVFLLLFLTTCGCVTSDPSLRSVASATSASPVPVIAPIMSSPPSLVPVEPSSFPTLPVDDDGSRGGDDDDDDSGVCRFGISKPGYVTLVVVSAILPLVTMYGTWYCYYMK